MLEQEKCSVRCIVVSAIALFVLLVPAGAGARTDSDLVIFSGATDNTNIAWSHGGRVVRTDSGAEYDGRYIALVCTTASRSAGMGVMFMRNDTMQMVSMANYRYVGFRYRGPSDGIPLRFVPAHDGSSACDAPVAALPYAADWVTVRIPTSMFDVPGCLDSTSMLNFMVYGSQAIHGTLLLDDIVLTNDAPTSATPGRAYRQASVALHVSEKQEVFTLDGRLAGQHGKLRADRHAAGVRIVRTPANRTHTFVSRLP